MFCFQCKYTFLATRVSRIYIIPQCELTIGSMHAESLIAEGEDFLDDAAPVACLDKVLGHDLQSCLIHLIKPFRHLTIQIQHSNHPLHTKNNKNNKSISISRLFSQEAFQSRIFTPQSCYLKPKETLPQETYPVEDQRNNNLRISSSITRNVARELVHILHKHRLRLCSRCPTDTTAKVDVGARYFSLEGSQDESFFCRRRRDGLVEDIESDPVDGFFSHGPQAMVD